jgi:hypothetical protein
MGEAEYIRDLEVHYLISLDAMQDQMSYNQSNGRKNFMGGLKSQDHKDKISAAQKSRKRAPFSPEQRAKMSAAAKGRPSPNKGKTASPEARANMRKPKSPAARANMSAAKKGKPLTEDHKDKISAAKKGTKYKTTSQINTL